MDSVNNQRLNSVSVYTNLTGVIHIGQCIVKSVLIAGNGAGGSANVHDGVNNKAETKAHLEVLTDTSFQWSLGEGSLFRYGIFIEVNAATTTVTVIYEPVTDNRFS